MLLWRLDFCYYYNFILYQFMFILFQVICFNGFSFNYNNPASDKLNTN